jgi:hypothetical protein
MWTAHSEVCICIYTGHTQKNGTVLIVFTIKTAPFFCVCPVYIDTPDDGHVVTETYVG